MQTLFRLPLRFVFIRVRSWLKFARAERVASLPGRNSHRATRSFYSNRGSGGRTRESTKVDDEYFVVAARKDRRSGRQHRTDRELFSGGRGNTEFCSRSVTESHRNAGRSSRTTFAESLSDTESDDRSAEISSAGCKIRFRHCHSNRVCGLMMLPKHSFRRFTYSLIVGKCNYRFDSKLNSPSSVLTRTKPK